VSDHRVGPEQGFEAALAELEARVKRLEGGDLPLDDALRVFEEGVTLAQRCHDHLEAAEQRVSQLVRGGRGIEERPLSEPE
jgi:exodeoxyribonuclease VII small subunit